MEVKTQSVKKIKVIICAVGLCGEGADQRVEEESPI